MSTLLALLLLGTRIPLFGVGQIRNSAHSLLDRFVNWADSWVRQINYTAENLTCAHRRDRRTIVPKRTVGSAHLQVGTLRLSV